MAVVEHFKSLLSRHGLCDTIVSDGGPQYTSDVFKQFCMKYGIEHVTSSPRYPLGNSEAERAVQTVKRLLSKCDDPYEAMMIYRATPFPHNGLSPCQMLFGRQIKTTLPQAPKKLLPSNINYKVFQNSEKTYRANAKQNYDRKRRAQNLPSLKERD
jgi:transposase InsO family protein